MHPIAWLIDNPVKVSVGVILLVMFGSIALFQMPMQLSPDVERPQVTVQTAWPGASPQEIENEIIKEQEERLKAVEGLVKMSSECMDSFGQITLEFRVGTKMDSALLKVNNALQQVPSYPIDAREPVIRTSNTNDNSIGWFILSPRPPSREKLIEFAQQHPDLKDEIDRVLRAKMTGLINYRLRELAKRQPRAAALAPPDLDMSVYGKFAEDVIEAQFERIPGVADAFVRGGRRPQMHVMIDPHRLAARGLTITDLRNALTGASVDVSAGDYVVGKSRVVVRVLGQYRSAEQILEQIVATQDGVPIQVRDVADVALGFEKTTGFVQRYGVSSMSVSVNRDVGANVMEIMRRLDREVERLNQGVLAQEGLMLTKVYDETTDIRSAVGLVQQNIVLGGALTIIVLMLFLHIGARAVIIAPLILLSGLAATYFSPWLFLVTLAIVLGTGFWFARGTLVVGIAIPISVIGTFLLLREMGRSLNVISLAGMAFAVGMLVDNAVVVLENIFRFWRQGDTALQAARRGVGEVWGAVLASTLTTLAVFLPVIFLQGEVGQLFGDIALAISAAVGLSLLVSVIVIPTAASRIMDERASNSTGKGRSGSRVAATLEHWGIRFRQGIVSSNRWLQESWTRRLVTAIAILVVIAVLGWWLYPKVEYLPAGNRNLVFCSIQTPPGYNVHQLNAIGREVEELLKPYWDIEPSTEDTSHLDYPSIADFFFMARERSVFVGMRAHNELKARKLIDLCMKKLDGRFPGAQIRAFQTSIFGRGLSGGRNIDIEITGPDLHRLVEIGGQVMGQVRQAIPNAQARPIPSLDLSS
ncbi:MAG TPA: efflux RND transporter permease subunit, partial [Pirellulaceae bacterium]|nr:efflux RND transporter permease subunit [Pirellulaceae bacterium]